MPSSAASTWKWIPLTLFCAILPSCGNRPETRDSAAAKGELKFTIPGTRGGTADLILDSFQFENAAVDPKTAQVRKIAPGVHEVTAPSPSIGEWQFAIRDLSSYYGFGERFDRLDHVHSILKNESRNTAGVKGTDTYKPIPFFLSLTGYGLWLDTYAGATFDLNVTDPARIRISVRAKKLRFVILEGPQFPKILERFTALVGRAQLPPDWAFAPWKARDYHRNQAEVYEDIDRYRQLGLPASVILIDSPWATNYNTYIFNPKQFEDPSAMVRRIHDEGFKLVLWHTSWINQQTNLPGEDGFQDKLPTSSAGNFAEADRNGYFVRRPDVPPTSANGGRAAAA